MKKHSVELAIIGIILLLTISAFFLGIRLGHSEDKPSAEPLMILTTETTTEVTTTSTKAEETWTITAYCSCEKCCGSYANNRKNGVVVGAEGTVLTPGYSAANNELPFGTVLNIDGYGVVEIQDRTANWINERYNGKIIDIYFDSHEKALEFGKKTDVIVTTIKEGD